MSTPSAKRRRLEDAQSALRKPFRSPFKTPSRKLEKPSAETTASSTAVPSPLVQSTLPDSSTVLGPTPPDSSSDSTLRTLFKSRSSTTLSTPSKAPPFARRAVAPDDPLVAAIRAEEQRQRQLSKQIKELRNELDMLDQALTIATSTKDASLEALARKWRDATRSAAEEVFATTKARVDGMGGISAWRQSEQRQQEWGQGFHAQEPGPDLDKSDDDDGDEDNELTADERGARLLAREQRAEARAEAKKERQWRKKQEEAQKPSSTDEGGDDDSFTMDMMLKTLNIDPEMIGWDKGGQRWVD
ncbi:hypothetical protein GTA08_BOTSDO09915 [Neofusicoccum parvum]|uniref:Uncharacterized protein n=1 Tax=Neofusicoccum parvum TaxID=310453 RepID=A0ACB5RWC3_9PEZI|nr:hypothetical protein GTA08_BOTSDO09915 [Neofusicoccum parvum]